MKAYSGHTKNVRYVNDAKTYDKKSQFNRSCLLWLELDARNVGYLINNTVPLTNKYASLIEF